MRKKTIEEVRQRGQELGYEFLSDTYDGSKIKYLWKCPNKHIISLRFNDLDQKENRCKECWSIKNGLNRTLDVRDLLELAASKNYQVCSPSLYKNCMERI